MDAEFIERCLPSSLFEFRRLYHVVFYWSNTIGTKDHEGNSHSVDKMLSKS